MENTQLKINLIQTLPATVQSEPTKTSKSEAVDGALIAIPILFLVIWAIASVDANQYAWTMLPNIPTYHLMSNRLICSWGYLAV